MLTTFYKVVEGSLQACQLSIRSDRSASTAPLNGLIMLPICFLLTHCFFLRILYIFMSMFFLLYPWTATYPCISNLSSLILHSSILSTFSQSFLTTWQFSWKFESRLCSWTISKLYQNYIKISKTLNHIQLNP